MLTLERENIFWTHSRGEWTQSARIVSDGTAIAEVELVWRNHFTDGSFEAGGRRFEVVRETENPLPAKVVCDDEVVMRATTSPGNHYGIEFGARRLQIHLDSILTTKWGVIENGKKLGQVSRAASMKKLAKSDLPADMDLTLLIFILCLTAGCWQHLETF
jgi:hypothetical protein